MRSTIFAASFALSLLATSARAEEGLYLSGGVAIAQRFGPLRWASPPAMSLVPSDNEPVRFTGRTQLTGSLLDFAVGVRPREHFAVAGEVGVGVFFGGSEGIPHADVNFIGLLRAGARVEHLFARAWFVRGGLGTEWARPGGGGQDIGARDNVFAFEALRGPYGYFGGGFRRGHLGALLRADVARMTSAHGTYTPITLALAFEIHRL